jgi:hypothetical protein
MWLKILGDTALYLALGAICVGVGVSIYRLPDFEVSLQLWIMAAMISVGCGIVISFLTLSPAYNALPAAMPLIAMFFRSGIYMAVILYCGATKWSYQNFFTNCLLGCFFPYLILESVLSIRRSSQP